ncbi:acid sphingomyelinase-like phosphodiesterase 3a [Canis lupus familiaris]|uniref:Acid sphingomyelinase-like phosphodiesterase n=2 Tax=Canis lupus familiaris TaxID=9615 RepID=A0A8C0MYI6_CANLF|nr:acid sphingomyelinase-like phosphodiesterase 3a [Canis lupus familiaris]XP_025278702.1 acid sphingomyelinase-like phosphodiesterase 3a [Canis lupus dingo]XP_038382612.1 acid sphingomyelinase-like phosphodiesterase 3a [Canis lupus familiaris]XP_038510711.1 acid sphingomyelinase-like phosphodiesterase 3a [Canis lupus familiaris]
MALLRALVCCLVAAGLGRPGLGMPLAPAGGPSPAPTAGQFWHVTDLHLDPTYHITDDHTKVCASSKGANASNPGPFGDVLCDSPYDLILSAFDFIKNSGQEASFMIWTGDSPPHVPVHELSTEKVINVIANMTATIQNLFPNRQVFPALGNHDYWPQDQLPVVTSRVYNAVADLWEPWLDEEALHTLRKGGFYSQKVSPNLKLRIISLNTNLYYGPNIMTLNKTDPADQFEWLENTLNISQQNNEKVYIIAHIPVGYLPYSGGTMAMREFYNEKLIEIFRKYGDIIAGQFYGHTHRDSIMVLSDTKGSPINSLFVAPAVTPVKSVLQKQTNNPGIRLFQYDPHDYKLLDMLQYYLNLTDANLKGESNWELEYVLTQTYNIEDLQPKSLYGLAKQFATPGNEQFMKYYKYFFVSYDSSVICDGKCKAYQICAILSLDHISYKDCLRQHYIKHHP